ncbi:MAG: bifunctional folylpolyglutamate synthase/dihydrofolate synthase [Clostridia bacterium]|nr:bifunctional folylpolyglutamate synthase/dihydrofolate synthase [Clostridia bacterium]
MNYNEALEYIHSLLVFGSVPGLERISQLLDSLGNPQDKLKFIHVAGTNGKGSTCTMLAEVYKKQGLKTGLYTSPYVVDFRERMQINGEYIPEDDLARLCETVKNTGITVTEFEFITALGLLWFYEQNCDIVILEVGLGGRFDATNIIKAPLCSVITRIDLDHTAVLGETLAEIAGEKCGIIKDNAPVAVYPLQAEEALRVIEKHSKKPAIPDIDNLEIVSSSLEGNTFIYKGREYHTRLVGEHQVYNALTVIEAVTAAGIPVTEQALTFGIASATIPARLELLANDPVIFLDGAHNPNGAEALAQFMENYKGDIVAVIGMMADKNCEGFLKSVLKFCRKVITVTVKENPRAISAEELKDLATPFCNDCAVAADYDAAIAAALAERKRGLPVFVIGSLYLAGAIRPKLISALNS